MATAASAVAARTARARRMIQHRFFSADAVRPDRAIAFQPADRFEQRWFDRMLADGAVHEEAPGHWWIDLPAYDAMLHDRLRRVRTILMVVLAILAGGLAIGLITLR